MAMGRIAGVFFLVILCAACASLQTHSQSPSRWIIEPSQQALGASSQQLRFTIAAPCPGLTGARVFVNPGSNEKLMISSEAYVGSVYFSHHVTGATSTFALPLKRLVMGRSELVLLPILAAKSNRPGAALKIVTASIGKPDNAEFH